MSQEGGKLIYENSKNRLSSAMTLLEMVIALAIMAIVFAAVVPQFRIIQNNWDSKQGSAETLQNSRVMADHLNHNLSKAVQITAVSDSSVTNGYIEFEDNAGSNLRYDVNSTTSYVEFGQVGSLSDLAGPVSQFQFTCYDACDLDTPLSPIVDPNIIRLVEVQATMPNSVPVSRDKTSRRAAPSQQVAIAAYIRANNDGPPKITKAAPFRYASRGYLPDLARIDSTHHLCAYTGPGWHGWAVVLSIDSNNWTISKKRALKVEGSYGYFPALTRMDSTHYLCAYMGLARKGRRRQTWVGRVAILKVKPGSWRISKQDTFDYENSYAYYPDLTQIDSTHYLCTYMGYEGSAPVGRAVVLTVAPDNRTISREMPFDYETRLVYYPEVAGIDSTHYLCAYMVHQGSSWFGRAVVLVVDTDNWTISRETPFDYEAGLSYFPALTRMDSVRYLCAYTGPDWDGWSTILRVNPNTWTVSKETAFEFDGSYGYYPALSRINNCSYLCTYTGPNGQYGWGNSGWAAILTIETENSTISNGATLEFETSQAYFPVLSRVDSEHYLCAYSGPRWAGYSVVLGVAPEVVP